MGDPDVKNVPHVKGGAFPDTLAVVEARLGERYGVLVEQLPPEFRDGLQMNTMVSTAWYPVYWMREIHRIHHQLTAGGIGDSEEIGYTTAMRQFTGLYRIFFRLMQPQTLLAKAGSIFGRFYSMGEFELLEAGPGHARSRFASPGFDANLWAETRGVCRAALEICGATDVRLRFVEGGGDADNAGLMVGTWET